MSEQPETATVGEFALHAWVDESMRITADDLGTYILASAVCDPVA